MKNRISRCMYVLKMSATTQKMMDDLMSEIYGSERVDILHYHALSKWLDKLKEVVVRIGEEYQGVFLKELRRQVMRLGGKPYDVDDRILVATLVELVNEIDPLMQYKCHPTMELMHAKTHNVMMPYGNVLYRGRKIVARKNRYNITVQMTGNCFDGEMEEMLDKMDDVLEEEYYDR